MSPCSSISTSASSDCLAKLRVVLVNGMIGLRFKFGFRLIVPIVPYSASKAAAVVDDADCTPPPPFIIGKCDPRLMIPLAVLMPVMLHPIPSTDDVDDPLLQAELHELADDRTESFRRTRLQLHLIAFIEGSVRGHT